VARRRHRARGRRGRAGGALAAALAVHASPAASLTVANMRHLLLDALWKKLPADTKAEELDRAVLALRRLLSSFQFIVPPQA